MSRINSYLNGDRWCPLGPKPDLRWLYLLGCLAVLLCGLAWGQAGIPDGCMPGIPTSVIPGYSPGVPGGCGPGIPISTTAAAPPPVGCAGTGFDFTKSCNSQYISVF